MAPCNVAVLGGGPGGLTSAKSCLERGMRPVVLEASNGIGGVWREGGLAWRGMRTNISQHAMEFSDWPW